MDLEFQVLSFYDADRFIRSLPISDQIKIESAFTAMRKGHFRIVYTKALRGPIRELIVKDYRVIYFLIEKTIYFVRCFRKTSAKTPKAEIEMAENIYKSLTKILNERN